MAIADISSILTSNPPATDRFDTEDSKTLRGP
jgi:hypothetical protein